MSAFHHVQLYMNRSLLRGAPRLGFGLGPAPRSFIRPLLGGAPRLGLALGPASARAGPGLSRHARSKNHIQNQVVLKTSGSARIDFGFERTAETKSQRSQCQGKGKLRDFERPH